MIFCRTGVKIPAKPDKKVHEKLFKKPRKPLNSLMRKIFQRTFHLRHGQVTGSCFTFSIKEKVYLVTAKHIATSSEQTGFLFIEHETKWMKVQADLIGHGEGNEDVSVYGLKKNLNSNSILEISLENTLLSEDVYFLGFPFNMKTSHPINNGFPVPFVNKAIVSALDPRTNILYLDGRNNIGFSGGPIVRASKPNQVIGVIYAYKLSQEKVNSGIIQACPIQVVRKILNL